MSRPITLMTTSGLIQGSHAHTQKAPSAMRCRMGSTGVSCTPPEPSMSGRHRQRDHLHTFLGILCIIYARRLDGECPTVFPQLSIATSGEHQSTESFDPVTFVNVTVDSYTSWPGRCSLGYCARTQYEVFPSCAPLLGWQAGRKQTSMSQSCPGLFRFHNGTSRVHLVMVCCT